jgi:hypothetical protein
MLGRAFNDKGHPERLDHRLGLAGLVFSAKILNRVPT